MSEPFKTRMAEATRLTQEGRLEEATAAIQRALGNRPPATRDDGGKGAAPIDITSRLVGSTRQGPAPSEHATRPASRPRGVRNPLGNMTGGPFGKAAVTVPEGARFVELSYANGAGERSYKLYVPAGYSGEAVPLIVMLHGCTQNPDDFAAGTRMNELAEEKGFLVAYPAQSSGANMQRCWNWFQAADQRRGRGEPSLIAGIARQVAEDYAVDEGRIYVAGMSAGGAMAAILCSEYPDLFAAAGVHSGLAPGSAHDMSSAFTAMRQGNPGAPLSRGSNGGTEILPTILFHGDQDGTVHPRNGDRMLEHLAVGDTSSLRVATRQGRVPDGHGFTRISYNDAEGRPVVERWTVHGLGHAWSGGGYPGSYTDPKGPDASAAMVRFFEQHARG